jgi:hypothetical protein
VTKLYTQGSLVLRVDLGEHAQDLPPLDVPVREAPHGEVTVTLPDTFVLDPRLIMAGQLTEVPSGKKYSMTYVEAAITPAGTRSLCCYFTQGTK